MARSGLALEQGPTTSDSSAPTNAPPTSGSTLADAEARFQAAKSRLLSLIRSSVDQGAAADAGSPAPPPQSASPRRGPSSGSPMHGGAYDPDVPVVSMRAGWSNPKAASLLDTRELMDALPLLQPVAPRSRRGRSRGGQRPSGGEGGLLSPGRNPFAFSPTKAAAPQKDFDLRLGPAFGREMQALRKKQMAEESTRRDDAVSKLNRLARLQASASLGHAQESGRASAEGGGALASSSVRDVGEVAAYEEARRQAFAAREASRSGKRATVSRKGARGPSPAAVPFQQPAFNASQVVSVLPPPAELGSAAERLNPYRQGVSQGGRRRKVGLGAGWAGSSSGPAPLSLPAITTSIPDTVRSAGYTGAGYPPPAMGGYPYYGPSPSSASSSSPLTGGQFPGFSFMFPGGAGGGAGTGAPYGALPVYPMAVPSPSGGYPYYPLTPAGTASAAYAGLPGAAEAQAASGARIGTAPAASVPSSFLSYAALLQSHAAAAVAAAAATGGGGGGGGGSGLVRSPSPVQIAPAPPPPEMPSLNERVAAAMAAAGLRTDGSAAAEAVKAAPLSRAYLSPTSPTPFATSVYSQRPPTEAAVLVPAPAPAHVPVTPVRPLGEEPRTPARPKSGKGAGPVTPTPQAVTSPYLQAASPRGGLPAAARRQSGGPARAGGGLGSSARELLLPPAAVGSVPSSSPAMAKPRSRVGSASGTRPGGGAEAVKPASPAPLPLAISPIVVPLTPPNGPFDPAEGAVEEVAEDVTAAEEEAPAEAVVEAGVEDAVAVGSATDRAGSAASVEDDAAEAPATIEDGRQAPAGVEDDAAAAQGDLKEEASLSSEEL
jgi:hypothetical protein